jgi:hypothetical protein
MKVKLENNRFVLGSEKGEYSFIPLYNKLYPLFLPEDIKNIPAYVGKGLNALIDKLSAVVYDDISIEKYENSYLIFNGNLKKELGYTNSKVINGDELIETILASTVSTEGIRINRGNSDSGIIYNSKTEHSDNIYWTDSHAYLYKTSNDNQIITGISFDAVDIFDYVIGRSLEFYEEFAVLGAVCLTSPDSVVDPSIVDESSDELDFAYVPRTGYNIPFELNICDLANQNQEEALPIWEYIFEYSQILDYRAIPASTQAGIGLRIKKNPQVPLTGHVTGLKEAGAKNIRIYWIDLNLDLGMNFTKNN